MLTHEVWPSTPALRAQVLSLLGGDHDPEEIQEYMVLSYEDLPSGLRRRLERMKMTTDTKVTYQMNLTVKPHDNVHWLFVGDIALMQVNFKEITLAMDEVDKAGPDLYKRIAQNLVQKVTINGTEAPELATLPIEPWSAKDLRQVIMGTFQIAWHKGHGVAEEEFAKIYQKQEGRQRHYLKVLEELKNRPQAAPKPSLLKDAVRGGGSRSSGTGSRTRTSAASTYQLVPAFAGTYDKWDKQKGIIVNAFKALGGPATAQVLTDWIEKESPEKMVTNQGAARVVAFYLGEWKKLGVVEIAEQSQPAPAEQLAPEAPKPDLSKIDTSKGKGKEEAKKKKK